MLPIQTTQFPFDEDRFKDIEAYNAYRARQQEKSLRVRISACFDKRIKRSPTLGESQKAKRHAEIGSPKPFDDRICQAAIAINCRNDSDKS